MVITTTKPERKIALKKAIPAFCCFGITDECMFRCKMCFKWRDDINVRERPPIAFEHWEKAIMSLKKIVSRPEHFVINFGGGEALLREDVLELVSLASQEGFITNLASNGWLIDEAVAERIAASGLRSINLSLDSLREGVHDELRGVRGACRQVQRAVTLLRNCSKTMEIGICTVIYERNLSDIMPLTKWVNQNDDINWIVFMAAMQPNNTAPEEQWYNRHYSYLWPKNKKRVFLLLCYLKWLKWWGWKIQNPYYQLDAFRRYFSAPHRFVKASPCNMDRALHISATGDIFLCFKWNKLGNIMTDNIDECWSSPEAGEARDTIRDCSENCHFLLNCFFEKEYPFRLINRFKKR